MWERCQELVEAQGSKVVFEAPVTKINREAGRAVGVVAGGSTYEADHVISSMPFNGLVRAMDPPAPDEVRQAADDLVFRDFLSVALVVPADKVAWTDNWIYIHDPEIKTMRVQNFGSWSPYMVKDGRNVLGLEYTVNEGDEWWTATDDDLIERGKKELEALGLMRGDRRRGGLRRADAEGVPGVRRDLPAERGRCCASGWRPTRRTCTRSGATACTGTTTRTTRCTPRCSRWRTSTAPTTTSGTSTSRRSTTRSRRRRRGRHAEAPVVMPRSSRRRPPAPQPADDRHRGGRRSTRSRMPHHVTSSIASTTIRPDIFDVPRSRSLKVIGSSVIAPSTVRTR